MRTTTKTTILSSLLLALGAGCGPEPDAADDLESRVGAVAIAQSSSQPTSSVSTNAAGAW